MSRKTVEILDAMAKIPGLKNLVIPVEAIPDDAEFEAMNIKLMAELDAILDSDLNFQCDATPPSAPKAHDATGRPVAAPTTPLATGTQRISIRVPTTDLLAYKAKARKHGTKYQTLMNRTLKAAIRDWKSCSHL